MARHPLAVANGTEAGAAWYRLAARAWLRDHDLPSGRGRTKAAVIAWLQDKLDEVKKAS
jgi:hypothetical protein